MKQRVVVIGASGFVGSTILKQFDTRQYEPIGIRRSDCDLGQNNQFENLSVRIHDGDVVVCAAAKAPAKNLDMLVENVAMIRLVADVLKTKKLTYVLNISSDAVYADSMEPLNESSTIAPLSAHGIMHCMREMILEKSVSAPLGHLRPTLIFGEGDPHNSYGPNSFIRLAREGKPIELFGEGEERRDHIHVADVAALAIAMIAQKITGPVGAVTGTVTSFMEIAQFAAQSSGGRTEIKTRPRSGPMPHNGYRAFDNARARSVAPQLQFCQLGDYIAAALKKAA